MLEQTGRVPPDAKPTTTMTTMKTAAMAVLMVTGTCFGARAQDAIDVQSLMACAIIYADASVRFAGDAAQAQSLSGASAAYAASGMHLAGSTLDVADAEAFAMKANDDALASLNAQIASGASEDDLVAAWLPWCDAIAPTITSMLADREARGW